MGFFVSPDQAPPLSIGKSFLAGNWNNQQFEIYKRLIQDPSTPDSKSTPALLAQSCPLFPVMLVAAVPHL